MANYPTPGDDIIYGDTGAYGTFLSPTSDTISGGDGNDTIYGLESMDWLYGNGGNDTLYGGASSDGLDGGEGDDSLYGGDGDDSLSGGNGDDALDGGEGNDGLVGGSGDKLDGGSGIDNFVLGLDDQTEDVTFLFYGDPSITYYATAGGKNQSEVKNVEILGGLGGGLGNDRLGGAVEFFDNGINNGSLRGGDGIDILVFDARNKPLSSYHGYISFDPYGKGGFYDWSNNKWVTFQYFERLEFTGNATQSIGVYGGAYSDTLIGLAGDDVFGGGGGADILEGGYGNDTLDGGTGANVISGGEGVDTASFDFSDQADDVVAVNGGVPGVLYEFTSGGKAHGSVIDVEFVGYMNGGSGNDRIGGSFSLNGNARRAIFGGGGADVAVIDLSNSTGSFSGGPSNGKGLQDDVTGRQIELVQIEAIEFTGNATGSSWGDGVFGGIGNDRLTGLAGNDKFRGGAGRDRLRGGLGNDDLDGGSDDDTAVFSGKFADYGFKFNKATVEVTGADGVDTLTSIEFVEFDDGVVAIGSGGFVTSTIAIDAAPVTKTEGTGGTTPFVFTLNRTGGTGAAQTVGYAVTPAIGAGTIAAAGSDFAGGAFPTGTVSFAVGESSKTLTVNVVADAAAEMNERFAVMLSNPSAGTSITTAMAQGIILNDDVSFAVAALGASKPEGTGTSTPFTFTVTRSGATAATQSVNWSVAGTTGSGTMPANATDFLGGALPSGTVTFTAGQTSRTVTVDVLADTLGEFNERFAVTLSGAPAGTTIATATAGAVIFNDDTSLAITPASTSKAEGNSGTTALTYTVSRSGITAGLTTTVDWSFTAGGVPGTVAVAGSDFVGGVLPPGGTLKFDPGQTSKTITLNIAGDTAPELNESFKIMLSNPTAGVAITAATASTAVIDDDTIYGTTGNDTLVGTVGPDLFVIGKGLDSISGGLGLDAFRFLPTALGLAASNAFTFEDFNRVLGEKFDLSRIDAIAGGADDPFSFIGTNPFNGTPGQLRWQDNGSVRLIQGNVNNDLTADLTIIVKAAGPVDANWFVL